MTGICCALVLGLAPLAGAHLTAPSATSAALTGDAYRWTDNTPSTNNGVSGTYIGASGVVVSGDIFPLTINPVLTLCPLGYCAAGNALCDLEVLSSGAATDPLKVLDESKVDGGNGVGGNNGGLVPDGTVDDGGLGAACHTDGYAEADYNTLGCSGVSHAEDAGSEYHVWISPSCDDSSQVSDGGVATCVVNAILAGGNGLVACTDGITCIVNQTCGVGTFQACGADGTADEVALGEGGGDVDEVTHNSFPFSNDPDSPGLPDEPGQGVAYPADIAACDPLATAATFVFEGVELNIGIGDDPAGPEYALAVGGWIDWTASGTTEVFTPDEGLTIDLCPTINGLPNPTLGEVLGCSDRRHEPPICYAWVHYSNGGFPASNLGSPPGPGAACFRSTSDAFAHANPLFFCTPVNNPDPNAPSPANQGTYTWDCTVPLACEDKEVEAFAHLWTGGAGSYVDTQVHCILGPIDTLVAHAHVNGPTPGGVDTDTGRKTFGDYHCIITMGVIADPTTGTFDGQAWCRDP